MTAFTPTNTPRRMVLDAASFTGSGAAPVAGVESVVGRFKVSDGLMLTLLHDQSMRMNIKARYEMNRAATAAGAPVTQRVQINGNGRRMQQTARRGREFPHLNHPDVLAYTLITGGVWTPARVLAVDWEAGWADVETPPNAGKVAVYYTFGDGEITVRASRPFGSSTGAAQIWNGSARGVNSTDQADRDTAIFLTRSPKPLPQGFTLEIAVRAASGVVFDGYARHELSIPASETAIMVHDPVMLAELAERQLRGL